ncbi:MAG: twin transmembrane helix small protein [bacterium]|nr:twin transmembrane helix small protein [bacterium]
MNTFFFILAVVALGATAGALALGLFNVVRGGSPEKSNKLMQARVGLQALALILLVAMVIFGRG